MGIKPMLVGDAEQEEVGENRVTQQPGGNGGGINETAATGRDFIADGLLHFVQREFGVRVVGEFGGRRQVVVDHGVGVFAVQLGQRVVAGRDHQVGAE